LGLSAGHADTLQAQIDICPVGHYYHDVGKVSAFAQAGLELFFNSLDHLPPHFHAERPGEWEVRVFFLKVEDEMIELKWCNKKKPSKKTLRELCSAAAQARPALLQEWEEKVGPAT
jgi:Domain of unknown function (DUF4160)